MAPSRLKTFQSTGEPFNRHRPAARSLGIVDLDDGGFGRQIMTFRLVWPLRRKTGRKIMAFQMGRASGVNICHFSRQLHALQSDRAAHGMQRAPFLPLFSLPDHASAGGLLQQAGGHCAADRSTTLPDPGSCRSVAAHSKTYVCNTSLDLVSTNPLVATVFDLKKDQKLRQPAGLLKMTLKKCDNLRVCCKTATQKCYKQRLY